MSGYLCVLHGLFFFSNSFVGPIDSGYFGGTEAYLCLQVFGHIALTKEILFVQADLIAILLAWFY